MDKREDRINQKIELVIKDIEKYINDHIEDMKDTDEIELSFDGKHPHIKYITHQETLDWVRKNL